MAFANVVKKTDFSTLVGSRFHLLMANFALKRESQILFSERVETDSGGIGIEMSPFNFLNVDENRVGKNCRTHQNAFSDLDSTPICQFFEPHQNRRFLRLGGKILALGFEEVS
jgi:hypothetical protein